MNDPDSELLLYPFQKNVARASPPVEDARFLSRYQCWFITWREVPAFQSFGANIIQRSHLDLNR